MVPHTPSHQGPYGHFDYDNITGSAVLQTSSWSIKTLSHDTHVNTTHSPVLQSAIQTWSSPFKDKLPLFAPNSLEKYPAAKAPIKMYPKTGSAYRQARPGSQTESLGCRAVPIARHVSSWGHEPQPSHIQAGPATGPAEPDPHPSLPMVQAQGDARAGAVPAPSAWPAACSWLGVGQALGAIPCPRQCPWNRHGRWMTCSQAQGCILQWALPDHCRNQHWRADLPPNTIFAVIFQRGIPSWAHARNISCPALGSQTQGCQSWSPLDSHK